MIVSESLGQPSIRDSVGSLGQPFSAYWRTKKLSEVRGRVKGRMSLNDKVIVLSAAAVTLIAAMILDKDHAPHKWHAAIMWTGVGFYGLLIFSRSKLRSWLFWIYWLACLLLHGFAMWLLFAKLLPSLVLGTLYVVPLAFLEAIFLFVLFSKLERTLDNSAHSARE